MKKEISKKEKVFLIGSLLIISLFIALSSAYIVFIEPNRISIKYDIFEILAVLPTYILILVSTCKTVAGKNMPIQKSISLQFYIFISILLSSYSAAFDLDVLYLSLSEPYSEWYHNLPKCFLFAAFFAVLLYYIKTTSSGKKALYIVAASCIVCEIFYFFDFKFYHSMPVYFSDVTRLATIVFWCITIIFFPDLLLPKRKAAIYKITDIKN